MRRASFSREDDGVKHYLGSHTKARKGATVTDEEYDSLEDKQLVPFDIEPVLAPKHDPKVLAEQLRGQVVLKAQESMARSSLFSGPTFRSETRKHTSGSVGAEQPQLEPPAPSAQKIEGPLLQLIPAKFYFFDPSREEEDELLINPRLVSVNLRSAG